MGNSDNGFKRGTVIVSLIHPDFEYCRGIMVCRYCRRLRSAMVTGEWVCYCISYTKHSDYRGEALNAVHPSEGGET